MRKTLVMPLPPISVWGTLLGTKAFIAKTKVSSNVRYGTHLAAAKIDDMHQGLKAKSAKRKEKKEMKKDETIKNDYSNVKESQQENVSTEETKEKDVENSVEIIIDVEPEDLKDVSEEVTPDVEVGEGNTMDFSSYIVPEDEELKQVTPEDLEEAIKAASNV